MKAWLIQFLTANLKTHNSVLMLTALAFFIACFRCQDAMQLTAIGGTLAALYGANAYAGKADKPTVSTPYPPAP